jgi:hypothetical protein
MIKSQFVKKLTNTFVTLTLLLNASGLATFTNLSTARAATVCTIDQQGANDVPGQKDLTRLCFDGVAVAGKVTASWQWDDIDWSGNNSGDACALFDTDGDGKANRALCVTINGSPASLTSVKAYTCTDSSVSRCGSPNSSMNATLSSCSIATNGVQPFSLGSASPTDTIASCTIGLSEVGGASAQLFDVCSYPSHRPNSDPSDCINFATSTPSTIEVKKVSNDPSGVFDLLVGGTTVADDIGNGYTTGPQAFDPANYVVSEAGNVGSPLVNYTSTYLCVDSSGATITSGSGVSTTVNLTANGKTAAIVCTFTNTRVTGPVTVVKDVVNDNGGTKTFADFHYSINGGPAQSFTATTSPDGSATLNLPTGVPVTITEPEANTMGYTTSYSNCVITPVNNQQQTCTITNDDIAPQLTVVKHVVNTAGGNNEAGDFTMTVTGTNVAPASSFAGSEAGTTVTLNAGSYSVSEGALGGYTNSLSADCVGSIALGEQKTCTITNTDVMPSMTVVKKVVNDDGGTLTAADFGISFGGSGLSWDAGVTDVATKTTTYTAQPVVVANTAYALHENVVSGYEAGQWSCTGAATADGQTARDISVTLTEGASATCTIINNDIAPWLNVIKQVINNDGGLLGSIDFPLFVDSTQVQSAEPTNTFDAGTHTISETQQPGYSFLGVLGDCTYSNGIISINMNIGGQYTCTLTNDDNAPHLSLVKKVTNDNGGMKVPGDWTLYATPDKNAVGATVVSGAGGVSNEAVKANVWYSLSEMGPAGYTASDWICSGAGVTQDGAAIMLELGATVSCEITNDDQSGTLIVHKTVINDNGGTAEADDFSVALSTGQPYHNFVNDSGSAQNGEYAFSGLSAGTYSPVETLVDDYAQLGSTCADVIVKNGETSHCTFKNDDKAPKLTLLKTVINDDGGTELSSAWELSANGPSPISGMGEVTSDETFQAGQYTLSEAGPYGYSPSLWDCGEQMMYGSWIVVLSVGDEVTCTITNDDGPVIIDISKIIVSDNGGTAAIGDFDISVNGVEVDNFLGNPYFEGLYFGSVTANANSEISVTEATVDGYENTRFVCSVLDGESYRVVEDMSEDTPGYQLEGTPGQSFFCSLVNDDIAVPSITVVKSGPASAAAGSTVTYTFTVTNTGNTLLDIDSVSDDIAGDATYVSGDTDGDGLLDLSEVWIFTANYTIPASQTANVVNTVTACAYEAFDEREEEVLVRLAEVIRTPDSCDTDTHTLKIPVTIVLSTPPKLSNTGVSSTIAMLMSGMILAAVVAVEVARRRSQRG